MTIICDLAVDAVNHDTFIDATGDLAVTSDANQLDAIAQDIDAAVRVFLGEWFLDQGAGVDYLGVVLVKNPSAPAIIDEFRRVVAGVAGVTSLKNLAFALGANRAGVVSFVAVTDFGEITRAITVGKAS